MHPDLARICQIISTQSQSKMTNLHVILVNPFTLFVANRNTVVWVAQHINTIFFYVVDIHIAPFITYNFTNIKTCKQ